MAFGDIIQAGLDKEEADKKDQLARDADGEDRTRFLSKFHEAMSGFGHKMKNVAPAKGNNPALDDAIIRDNNSEATAVPPPPQSRKPIMSPSQTTADVKDRMSGMGGGVGKAVKGAGGFLHDRVEGGLGGAYVDEMNKDTPAGVQATMPGPMRAAPEIEKMFFGGLEQAVVWGKGFGEIGRTLQPIARMMPPMLGGIFKNAIAAGSLSAGTEALVQKERGEQSHDLAEDAALGALIGGAAGYLHPDDAEVLKKPENIKALWNAAGGQGGKSMREMQRVAGRIAGKEYSAGVAINKVAAFTQGSGDQAIAAKLRTLGRSEPELFKGPLTKKILASANRDDAGSGNPAVAKTPPGTVARIFNYPAQKSEVVAHEGAPPVPGAKRGPLGIPLSAADDPAKVPDAFKKQPTTKAKAKGAVATTTEDQAALIKGLAERKEGEVETPAGAAARKAVSQLVIDGTLKPEMVTNGAHARGVQMALGETARHLEGKPGFAAHFDAMTAWGKRARALKGAPEFSAKPVDGKSAVALKQLKDEIDGETPVETNPTAPAKVKMTRGMMEKKRGPKPKFC